MSRTWLARHARIKAISDLVYEEINIICVNLQLDMKFHLENVSFNDQYDFLQQEMISVFNQSLH